MPASNVQREEVRQRREQVAALHAEGLAQREIAARLGVAVCVVSRDMEHLRLGPRKRIDRVAIARRRQRAAALHARGLAVGEIARQLEVPPSVVSRDLIAVLAPPGATRQAHAPLVLAALDRLEEALGKLSPATEAALAPVRVAIEYVRKLWDRP